jgi:hypothetical protein
VETLTPWLCCSGTPVCLSHAHCATLQLRAFGDGKAAQGSASGGLGGSSLYLTQHIPGGTGGQQPGAGVYQPAKSGWRATLDAALFGGDADADTDTGAAFTSSKPSAGRGDGTSGARARSGAADGEADDSAAEQGGAARAAPPVEGPYQSASVKRAKEHLKAGRQDLQDPPGHVPVPPHRVNPDALTVARWEAFNARQALLDALAEGRLHAEAAAQAQARAEAEELERERQQAKVAAAQAAQQTVAAEMGSWCGLHAWGAGGNSPGTATPPPIKGRLGTPPMSGVRGEERHRAAVADDDAPSVDTAQAVSMADAPDTEDAHA